MITLFCFQSKIIVLVGQWLVRQKSGSGIKLGCMKPFLRFWAVLIGLVVLSAAFGWAQQNQQLYVYSRGIFLPSDDLRFDLYSYGADPSEISVTYNKVLEPFELLRLKPNDGYSAIKIPENVKTSVLKRNTVKMDRNYGQVNLGKLAPGLYLLGFSAGQAKGIGIALVTDLGMIVKRADKNISMLTVNRVNGQRRSATVYGIDAANTKQIRTDTNGLGKLVLSTDKNGLIVANSGNSWAVSRSWWQSYGVEKWKITGQTDRPLYKPADSVSFRGSLREGNTLKPIKLKEISAVACYDNTELWRGKPLVNEFGSFSATFSLSRRAKTAEYERYRVFVAPSGEAACNAGLTVASFQVEDYIKPEFSVALENPEIALQGSNVKVAASAEYLFGGGVSGGKVNLQVSRAERYRRDDPRYSDFGYYWGEWDYWQPRQAIILEKNTVLGDNGKLEVSVPLERDPDNAVVAYNIQTTIEDETRRPQTTSKTIIAYPSTVRVAVRSSRYVVKAGEEIEMDVRTRTLEGETADAPVELTLVRRDYWYNSSRWTQREERLETRTVTTKKGNAVVRFKAPKGGGYSVMAKAKDPENRVSLGEAFVWVTEDNPSWYWWYEGGGMQVKMDKREYKVGDTAVAFISGIKQGADVWLTLEGNEILNQRLSRAAGGNAAWTFKITKEMQPNIVLKAGYLANGSRSEEEVQLSVPKVQEKLSIEILPAKQKFQAGEQGLVKLRVKDANGQPVKTELAVTVVDKGIYLLKEDNTPDPFDVLHGSRYNLVGTVSSEDEPLYIDAPRAVATALAAPAAKPAMSMADSSAKVAESATPDVKVRKDFRDTADWRASLITNENGEVTMTVPFPENLTTWRITARGQTIEAKAGANKTEVMVTQDIITRISQPSFLVRGDSFQLRGIVNNNRETTTTGKFSLALNGLSTNSPLETSLSIKPGQRGSFDARVTATEFGVAKVMAKYADSLGGDALELPINVKPRGFTDGTGWAADAKRGAKKFSIPNDANLESARLKIALTPSLLSAVRPALEQLIGYPYGCTEQTLSRFLPTLLAQQAFPRDDLPELLDAGLTRLETLRHDDGGWGFWTQDNSTLEMTSQVVLALARAKSAGVKFESYLLEGAVNWLRQNINDTNAQRGAKAVAYRALAEANSPATDSMDAFAALRDLEPYHLGQLALAYQKLGKLEEAKKMLTRLKSARIETDSNVRWERPNRQYRWYYYWEDNPVLVTAVALEALAKIEPRSTLIPKTINYLLQQRRGYWWVSTQDTAATVIAALALPKPADSNQTVRVLLNGIEIASKTIDEKGATLELDPKLKIGENSLEVRGDLNYAASLEYVREPERLIAESNGINVAPTYYKLEKKWNEAARNYDYTPVPLIKDGVAQAVDVGDMIAVNIRIKPESGSMRHLQVIQPVPAGFSAVNENGWDFEPGRPIRFQQYWRWWYWYSGREIYQDRVELYADTFGGEQEFTVILRAQTPGTFTALPTTADLMYDPSVRGRSSAATLTIKE
jgi:alpha-2-macroglobulin